MYEHQFSSGGTVSIREASSTSWDLRLQGKSCWDMKSEGPRQILKHRCAPVEGIRNEIHFQGLKGYPLNRDCKKVLTIRRLEANSGTGWGPGNAFFYALQVLAHSGPPTLLEYFLSLSTFPSRRKAGTYDQRVDWPGVSPGNLPLGVSLPLHQLYLP